MKRIPAILTCGVGLAHGLFAATIDYDASDEIFANPERGFYVQHSAIFAAGEPAPSPLNPNTLENHYAQNVSLILRFYVYETSRSTPLTPAHLDLIDQDCAVLRQAGLKAVLRFGYTIDPADPDAPLDTVLQHIDQLAPVLAQNADAIATVQAGFIGTWGEWHSSSHGLGSTENKRIILQRLLAAVPPQRAVGVRTPRYKQAVFNSTVPIDSSEAFSGSDLSRTGHHNDCFLANDSDFGTYLDPGPEKLYLNRETRYVPMGGETCNPNAPRTLCPTAIAELAQMHWSYLNSTYHASVLSGWSDGGCMDEIRRRLGYRLRLVRVEIPEAIRPGDVFPIRIALANDGFAAPYNPRLVELVLRHDPSGATYDVTLPEDPRTWMPTPSFPHILSHLVLAPRDLPTGNYDLLLSLPDPEPGGYGQPRYAIRLANPGVWETTTGDNHLLVQLAVSTSAPASTPEAGPVLAPAPTDAAPTPVAYANAPVLDLDSPSQIGTTSATVRGRLSSDGGVNSEARVYWGESEGGTDPAAWAAWQPLGPVTTGVVEASLSGLAPDTSYAYRFQATSPAGAGWGPGDTLVTIADADGDGLPDWWETTHFGGPTHAISSADADGDGHPNADEFVTLTDPWDPDSRFIIEGASGGAPTRIQYLSATGRVYALEGNPHPMYDLGNWQELGASQPGTGSPQQFTDFTTDPYRCYRVRVSIP